MKRLYIGFLVFTLFFLGGCGGNSNTQRKIKLIDGTTITTGVNPNSMAAVAKEKQEDRQNKVEISKIEAQTKIELEKIRSQNQLSIAKLNAQTQKEIAQKDAATQIKTSQIEVDMKREGMQYGIYLIIAVIVLVVIALFLLYFNAKKNRELQKKLHQEKLMHEQFLKEKELEEQRVHKLLELVASGKVAKNVEKEIILSIAKPKYDKSDTVIEKKD